jgi:myo-inositol-1(or 4)-monophosphatase
MEALAREAGRLLLTRLPGRGGATLAIAHKSAIDLVTDADRLAEDFLLAQVRADFPDHAILTEESGWAERRHGAGPLWIIDPLDGTVNFAHGVPIFCVSLAYAEANQIELGVVYDPSRDECFAAARGAGVWLNGAPLCVSAQEDLDQALLVTGFPYDIRQAQVDNLAEYSYFARHSQGVRRLGSAALDLAYVAAGRFDGYWEMRLKPWDWAAGVLLVQEAGGRVSGLDDAPLPVPEVASLAAANPRLHAALLAGLQTVAQNRNP